METFQITDLSASARGGTFVTFFFPSSPIPTAVDETFETDHLRTMRQHEFQSIILFHQQFNCVSHKCLKSPRHLFIIIIIAPVPTEVWVYARPGDEIDETSALV